MQCGRSWAGGSGCTWTGLLSRQEVMPSGSPQQLFLAWHALDKQADVLRVTFLTQRVWELRYSLPGVQGRGKDRTQAADSFLLSASLS